MAFHEYESACEQSPSCSQLASISRVRCVRECVSPSCYSEIYQSDQVKIRHHPPNRFQVLEEKNQNFMLFVILYFQLEEGEIDVRLNSFKGCFVQRVHRQRP